MTFEITTSERKTLIRKIEELAGQKPAYTGAPEFAYVMDGIRINNDGTVTADENADAGLLQQLTESGLIKPANKEEESSTLLPEDGTGTKLSTEETEAAHEEDSDPIRPSYSFPLSQHTPVSICNLVFMIYAKGDLLSKSTGGNFFVSEALKDELIKAHDRTIQEILSLLGNASSEDLRGITFTDGSICFDGFPDANDSEVIRAWMRLCEAINKAAIRQKRVQVRRNAEPNEKFAFRTWLVLLGMTGPDYKADRAIYYRNLTGHTAFRTPADEERWKQRQAERRLQMRAGQAEGSSVPTTEV